MHCKQRGDAEGSGDRGQREERRDEKKRETDETGSLEGARRREGERSEGKEGNLQQGEPEPLSEQRIVSSRHGKVSSADGRAVSILPIIVGLKGYLKKACIANSPPTCPISYEGPSRPLLPSQPPSLPPLPPLLSVNPQDPKRCVRARICMYVCTCARWPTSYLAHRGAFDTWPLSVTRLHRGDTCSCN